MNDSVYESDKTPKLQRAHNDYYSTELAGPDPNEITIIIIIIILGDETSFVLYYLPEYFEIA